MAETPDTDKLARRDPDAPAADPITSRSTSAVMLISALLLTGVLVWSLYDEVYGMRPWKSYQQSFVKRFDRYLARLEKRGFNSEKEVKQSPEYQRLDTEAKAARAQVAPKAAEIDRQVASIDAKLNAISDTFQDRRGRITVAFGTSTPTSMTVVATSTSSSPARNWCITASFSREAIRPWSRPTRRPTSSLWVSRS